MSITTSHPLEGLMRTTMESIREMVDVNTILGEPIGTPDGTVIIPISRVAFGFAAGGTEYEGEGQGSAKPENKDDRSGNNGNSGNSGNSKGQTAQSQETGTSGTERYPFGGGTGAGISLQPVAFLIVANGSVRLLPVEKSGDIWNRLIDIAPSAIDKLKSALGGEPESKEESDPCKAEEEKYLS